MDVDLTKFIVDSGREGRGTGRVWGRGQGVVGESEPGLPITGANRNLKGD